MSIEPLNLTHWIQRPLERTLVKQMMQNRQGTLLYDHQESIWKINGRAVVYNPKAVYGRFTTLFLEFLHLIKTCVNSKYNKHFDTVKLQLRNVHKPLPVISTAAILNQIDVQDRLSRGLETAPTTVETKSPLSPLNPNSLMFLSFIYKATESVQQLHLWQKLLEKFYAIYGEDYLESYVETDTQVILNFKYPLRMWLSSKDENQKEDPEGGVIFMLGSNLYNKSTSTHQLIIKNEKQLGHLLFKKGLELFIMTPKWAQIMTVWRMKEFDTTLVTSFKDMGSNIFSMKAIWGGAGKSREKSFQELLKNWTECGEVIPITTVHKKQLEEIIKAKLVQN